VLIFLDFIWGGWMINMAQDSDNKIFGDLSNFGFDNLDNFTLYAPNEEKRNAKKENINERSPLDAIYEKKLDCPNCYSQIVVPAVKTSAIRITAKDTDFMIYYQSPNPSFYDVWFCKVCGYAAMSNRFANINDTQKKLIKGTITSKWKFSKEYPILYTEEIAIETHQLALLNAVVKRSRDSEKAMICLKIAWLYRLKTDAINEKKYLRQALHGFLNAYEKETFPIAGLDGSSAQYLIGELYRRVEDNSNSLLWFGRVLMSRTATEKIKSMTRDQKDKIIGAKSV
jgi:uncharacterized protein